MADQVDWLQQRLRDVCEGLAIVEGRFQVALKGHHGDVPFGLDQNEGRLYHAGMSTAYQHALEMCSSEELKAFVENGFSEVTGKALEVAQINRE